MKIESYCIYSFPVRAKTDWLILELISQDKTAGYSEITMSNYEERTTLISYIKKCMSTLSGSELKNDLQVKMILEKGKENTLANNTSISGVRSACSDIFSKLQKLPMNIYLNKKMDIKNSDSIELYANINRSLLPNDEGPVDRSPNSFLMMAKKAKEAGFKNLKCAPFDGFDQEAYENKEFINLGLEKVSLISKELKNEMKILVDCHSKFNFQESKFVEKKLNELGVEWFEEPMNPLSNLEELRALKKEINSNLVGGEEFYGVNNFNNLIKNNFLDIVMPDIKYCGGIEEALSIGLSLENISKNSFSIHCPSGPISLAGSAHVTSALNSILPLEHAVFEIEDRYDYTHPNERIIGGKYILSSDFGIGVKPNFSKRNTRLLKEII